jgi:ABC-type transport system involved in multi-copper enzyme maturation permease subunit
MLGTAYSLFLRRELPAKQTLVLTMASLLPAAIAAIVRATGRGKSFLEDTGAPLTLYGPAVLVPIFYAVSAFHEEFESRTIVYLLTRPPSRATYVIGKFLAAWTCAVLSTSLGILVMGAVCAWGQENPTYYAATVGKLLTASWLATGLYTGLFLVFGMWLRNPVIYGLIFTFGWEYVVGVLPGQLQRWTVGMYPKALFIQWADADAEPFFPWMTKETPGVSAASAIESAVGGPELTLPSLLTCAITIPALMAGFLVAAIVLFQRREDA